MVKVFDFILSFFISPEKRAAIEWDKPVPTWMSITMWVIYLGIIIYSIVGLITEV